MSLPPSFCQYARKCPQVLFRKFSKEYALCTVCFASSSIILPKPSFIVNKQKMLLKESYQLCPIHSRQESIRSQIEKLKEETRPKTIIERIMIGIRWFGRSLHLALRSIHILVIFTPTFISWWFLFIPALRRKWYRLLVSSLQMGGSAFMKLGQWAATRPDILPIELCKELSTLHSTVACIDYVQMRRILETELDQSIYSVFDEIDETPIGSGCIAQVYRARIRGSAKWVALKIKRPDVDYTFREDLQLVNCAAKLASFLPFMQYIDPEGTAILFTHVMEQQLDFRIEAINLIHFRENFRDDDQFTFPEPYLNLTTSSLLVESYEPGIPLAQVLQNPSPSSKRVATLGMCGFLHMLLVDNFLHSDLHPGNILVRERVKCQIPLTKSISHYSLRRCDCHPQLVFLDTGLVAELEESQKKNFIDLFVAIAHGDGHEAGRLLIERAPPHTIPIIDPEGYMREIEDLVNQNMDNGAFNLSKMEIANALTHMLTSSLSHHVPIDTRFINLFMSVIILEGVGRQLDPSLNIIASALPIIRYAVPEYEKAAQEAAHSSRIARKTIHAIPKSIIVGAFKRLFHLDTETVEKKEFFKYEEGIDEKGSSLISIYDAMEKDLDKK